MTIDGAIKYYSNKNVVRTAEEAVANTIALNTMRKYQKIDQIISDGYLQGKSSGEMLLDIKGVMNGNDK